VLQHSISGKLARAKTQRPPDSTPVVAEHLTVNVAAYFVKYTSQRSGRQNALATALS
jgi:hypothetical protein